MFQMHSLAKEKLFAIATVEGGKATSTKYNVQPPKDGGTTVPKIKFYLLAVMAKQCCLFP